MLSLLTGFPGFIGTRLAHKLLTDDPDLSIVAIVEPRMVGRAREVAAGETHGDRIRVIEGDITDPKLGLSDSDYDQLAADVDRVYHLAAIYALQVPEDLARRVNVEGTRHVIDFCRACKKLERHHYVSTSYVAGKRKGLVLESELDEGQKFKNHYEATKFAAEVLVKDSMADVPSTIYRPGIVVGDQFTGETTKFDGPYFLLRTLSINKELHLPVAKMGTDEATFNAVPVNFIFDAIAACTNDPETVGATLALVDPQPLTTSQLYRALSLAYMNREPTLPALPKQLLELSLRTNWMRKRTGNAPHESLVFMSHPVQYDATEATRHLARSGVRCPGFSEYVATMVDFYRTHEHDPRLVPPL
jgi:thioester reductase-like protein